MEELLRVLRLVERRLNALVWGPWTLALLLGVGILLTLRTRGVQFRRFGEAMRCAGEAFRKAGSVEKRNKGGKRGSLTGVQAACTALAATVGTGNIAGVTGAIFLGGPGAVFWMWVSALFGMCVKYAEIALAAKYRVGKGENLRGGPMYYMEKGLGRRFRPLACVFALCGGLACFGIGGLAQSGEIAGAAAELLRLPPALTGGILAAVTGLVLLGGIGGVGKVTEKLTPLMAGFYLLCGVAAAAFHLSELPLFFGKVLAGAFGLRAAGGGVCGAAIAVAVRHGLARGVFSNEAGLGSAALVHGSAPGDPARQGLWGIFEVFVDTMVICTVTAFAVVSSGVTDTPGGLDAFPSPGAAAAAAFDQLLPLPMGGAVVRISTLLFAFSSILGWSCAGESCWRYLSRGSKTVSGLFRLVFALVLLPGAMGGGARMWEAADTLNGLMVLPNLLALALLSGQVKALADPPRRGKG